MKPTKFDKKCIEMNSDSSYLLRPALLRVVEIKRESVLFASPMNAPLSGEIRSPRIKIANDGASENGLLLIPRRLH